MRVGHAEADLDLYLTLQVSPTASVVDIRRAHRRLVRRHHPDRIRGDARARDEAERQMKAINHAASVLLDVTTRAAYDTLRGRPARRVERPVTAPERAWYDAPPTPPSRADARHEPTLRDRFDAGFTALGFAHAPRSLWALVGGAMLASMLLALTAPLLGGPVPVSSPDYRIPKGPQRETMWASMMR